VLFRSEGLLRASRTTSDIVDAAGNASRVLSPAQFARFFEQNAAIAREIFDPPHLQALGRLAADFAESSTATRTVAAAGSNTAQNLSVANLISRTTNGLIDPGNPLAQTFAGMGGLVRLIYAAPEAAVREMLTRAVVDPQFARMLLAQADPANLRRAMGYIETNMMDRMRDAALTAGARAGVRTGTAAATQPPQQ
jgi:hypothetical protein